MLQVNTQRAMIAEQADKSIDALPVPEATKTQQKSAFKEQQDNYGKELINAFTSSLHHIFLVSSALMFVAFILALFVKEKPLRSSHAMPVAE
jgi:hypothetical protein